MAAVLSPSFRIPTHWQITSSRKSSCLLSQPAKRALYPQLASSSNGVLGESLAGHRIGKPNSSFSGGENSGKFEDDHFDILIVGAGIAGLATALGLQRLVERYGVSLAVLEAAPQLREGGAALNLWGNAWAAMDALGIAEELRPLYTRLRKFEIFSSDGSLLRQFQVNDCVEAEDHEVRGVRRGELLRVLAAGLPYGTIRFGARVKSLNLSRSGGNNIVTLEDGSLLSAQVLIGCDGANSAVARALGLPGVASAGYWAARGVASYGSGEGSSHGGHGLGETIRLVLGQGVRAGMYPLTRDSVYWFTCFNSDKAFASTWAPQGFAKLTPSEKRALALQTVKGWDCGVEELIHQTPDEQLTINEITERWLFRAPWASRFLGSGEVTLAGDAAHPMTPNLGQGAALALEDAVVLARELSATFSKSAPAHGEARSRGEQHSHETDAPYVSSSRAISDMRSDLEQALARYEISRSGRATLLTLRSSVIGSLLQLQWPLVCFVRDRVVLPHLFRPDHFLEHAEYDCGSLTAEGIHV